MKPRAREVSHSGLSYTTGCWESEPPTTLGQVSGPGLVRVRSRAGIGWARPGFPDVPSWTPTLSVWSWRQTEKRKEAVTASTSPTPAGDTQQTVGLSGNRESSLMEQRSDMSTTPGGRAGFGGQPQALMDDSLPEPGSPSQPSPHWLGSAHDAKNISEAKIALPPRPCTSRPPPLSPPSVYAHAQGMLQSSFH